jgi:hypothetical protein
MCLCVGGMTEVAVSCRVVRVLFSPVSSHRTAILPVFGILGVLVLCRTLHFVDEPSHLRS